MFNRKIEKYIPFILLTIVILICCNIMIAFFNKQNILQLESNDLKTEHHILIDTSNFPDIKEEFTDTSYWCLSQIEKNTFYFFSNNLTDKAFPIIDGSYFSEKDTLQAIIGKSVKTSKINEIECIEFNEKLYEVVGYIGLSKDSPVSNFKILKDKTIVEKFSGDSLIIDSHDIEKLDLVKEKYNLKQRNEGLGVWLDLSKYTYILYVACNILLVLISVFICNIYVNAKFKINYYKNELGLNKIRIYMNDLIMIILVSCFILLTNNLCSTLIGFKTEYRYINELTSIIIGGFPLYYLFIIYTKKQKRW